jgi:hypothetical protein
MAKEKTTAMTTRRKKVFGIEERAPIAFDLYQRMLDGTESLELRFVGSNTAYLMGAILGGLPSDSNCLQMHVTVPTDVFYVHTLRRIFFIPRAKVWGYVQLADQHGVSLPSAAVRCLVEKKHLNARGNAGFCHACGCSEGDDWRDALAFADMGLADPNYKDDKVTRLPMRR